MSKIVTIMMPDGTKTELPVSRLPDDEVSGLESLKEYEIELEFDMAVVSPESIKMINELADRLAIVGVKLTVGGGA